jgi:hypothetical protein
MFKNRPNLRELSIKQKIEVIHTNRIWYNQPVFSFTSDIDWASEAVMKHYFRFINELDIKPTLYVTHHSDQIQLNYESGNIERGIHPNFLNESSHGKTFKEVAETCVKFAPEAYGFRSHRAFDVTDITHLMYNEYSYKYVSHQITIFQPLIIPVLHESGLINFPVFFEDGTHLYNKLNNDFHDFKKWFVTPGIKIISFHPMNFVFNSGNILFMRSIKDSLSREEFRNISDDTIKKFQNNRLGIRNTILEIIEFVKKNNFLILSMNEMYNMLMEESI